MSRANVAKSRTDKASAKAAAAPTIAHEIVAGKFDDKDWNVMTDHDEGDDFIIDIIEDVCSSAMDTIFQNYIQKQLVPYTVLQAKDAILQIIEWQFLQRDEGESNITEDPGWVEDEEPEPAVTDCWAQGSVPAQKLPTRTPEPVIMEEPEEEAQEEAKADKEHSFIVLGGLNEDEEKVYLEEGEAGLERYRAEKEEAAAAATLTVEDVAGGSPRGESIPEDELSTGTAPSHKDLDKPVQKKKKKFRPHKGPLKSAGLKNMTESLDSTEMAMLMSEYQIPPQQSPDPLMMAMPTSCHSLLKLQAGRPPGNRDVAYDEQGNVVAVSRIDPSKLPTHSVRTKFLVVDPEVEAAQARLEAMRTGRHVQKANSSLVPRPPISPRQQGTSRSRGKGTGGASHQYGRANDGVTPLPPPLIEAMELAPGVVVKEGDRVKRGPRQQSRKADLIAQAADRGLRPIKITATGPTISVQQLLEHATPIVRPLVDNTPVPPIRTPPATSY